MNIFNYLSNLILYRSSEPVNSVRLVTYRSNIVPTTRIKLLFSRVIAVPQTIRSIQRQFEGKSLDNINTIFDLSVSYQISKNIDSIQFLLDFSIPNNQRINAKTLDKLDQIVFNHLQVFLLAIFSNINLGTLNEIYDSILINFTQNPIAFEGRNPNNYHFFTLALLNNAEDHLLFLNRFGFVFIEFTIKGRRY